MMNMMELTPFQLLDYCMTKLRRIPYTIETEITVGEPVKEVTALLGKLQEALYPKQKEDTEQAEI